MYEYFTGTAHFDNFTTLLKQRYTDSLVPFSNEYMSALFILSIPSLFNFSKNIVIENGIDFPDYDSDSIFLTSSQLFLVKSANSLFRGFVTVDLSDICLLDKDNLEIFLTALQVRITPKILLTDFEDKSIFKI